MDTTIIPTGINRKSSKFDPQQINESKYESKCVRSKIGCALERRRRVAFTLALEGHVLRSQTRRLLCFGIWDLLRARDVVFSFVAGTTAQRRDVADGSVACAGGSSGGCVCERASGDPALKCASDLLATRICRFALRLEMAYSSVAGAPLIDTMAQCRDKGDRQGCLAVGRR